MLGVTALLVGCLPNTTPTDPYRDWLATEGHAADVAAYTDYLRTEGVADVVPMPELLRTSRRWRRCRHAAYAVPPRALWPNIVPTLRLIARIETETGLSLDGVRSGWRAPEVNRCAGGAERSRHLQNVAFDIDLDAGEAHADAPASADADTTDTVARLCTYWRTHGRARAMGLGFYTPTRIHIDTAGFRTWGEDHRRASSLCVRGDAPGR